MRRILRLSSFAASSTISRNFSFSAKCAPALRGSLAILERGSRLRRRQVRDRCKELNFARDFALNSGVHPASVQFRKEPNRAEDFSFHFGVAGLDSVPNLRLPADSSAKAASSSSSHWNGRLFG